MPIKNLNYVSKKLLAKKNVHAVFMKNGKLIVQVEVKESLDDLANHDIVPRTVDDVRTDVVVAKKVKTLNKFRPLIGGISCCESNIGAATLGCIVRDSTDGLLVGLTNNHAAGWLFDINYVWPVYGNTALSHIKMLQPSPFDGGVSADNIGSPKRAIATQFGPNGENYIDAAAINLNINAGHTDIRKISRGPFSFVNDRDEYPVGMTVYKMGRTTGLTVGTIVSNQAAIQVTTPYDDTALYYDQIYIESNESFGESGDSGSVVLIRSQGSWKIIGLFFAGTEDGLQTFANHIGNVSSLLQVEAWNGNIVLGDTVDYALVSGRCYKHKGPILTGVTHNLQHSYNTCAACKGNQYPGDKVRVVM